MRAEGAPRLPFDPERRRRRRPPAAHAPAPPPTPEALVARVAAAPLRGPGEPPAVAPVLAPAALRARGVPRDERPRRSARRGSRR